ncbi:MAG: hypothetical protein ACRCVX_12855 [Shewanella sp.]
MRPDAADVFASTGSKAKIVFVFPGTCTIPANGTAFKIWGNDFVIDSATDFSSTSFKVVSSGIFTIINFGNMILANIFFQRAATLVNFRPVGPNFEITLQWRECREQPNFAGANMNLAVFSAIGGSATPTNGVSPVYIDAYRLLVRAIRWIDASNEYFQLAPFSGLEVEKLCDVVGQTCLKINDDVASDLFTILPELTYTSFVSSIDNGRSMMRYYGLEYGSTFRTACVPKSGTITRSNRALVINAAFDIEDPYQMRRYWKSHPQGLPPGQSFVDFLTTQPKTLKLCRNSYKWLWMLNHWQDDGFPQYALLAEWTGYRKDGVIDAYYDEIINDPTTMGSSSFQAVCFNASPMHLFSVLGSPQTGIVAYEIQVKGVNPANKEDVYFNATEYLRFEIEDCCGDHTDLYFLSPTGSIDTVVVRVDYIETLQSGGEEIQVQVPCDSSRTNRATNGGRRLVGMRAYQKVYISMHMPRTNEHARWLKHIRQSPQRWIRVKDEGGNWMAKSIVFENGAIKTKESGAGNIIEMVGYLQDIPTQKSI